MCLLPCVPVGQVLLLRPMGAESDDYESVTAEEEERDASPPPPAGVTPKAKAIIPPRAPSMPPPTHGAYVKAVKDEKLSSSPSVLQRLRGAIDHRVWTRRRNPPRRLSRRQADRGQRRPVGSGLTGLRVTSAGCR